MTTENQNNSHQKSSQTLKTIGLFVGGLIVGGVLSVTLLQKEGNRENESLITVDGKTYTASNLPGDARTDYARLENSIFNAKKNFSIQTALRIALAKDAGKTISDQELPTLQDLLPQDAVTDAEAKDYYDKIVKKVGDKAFNGQPFEKVEPELKKQLSQQKMRTYAFTKLQEFEKSSRIQFLLPAPTALAFARPPMPPQAPQAQAQTQQPAPQAMHQQAEPAKK